MKKLNSFLCGMVVMVLLGATTQTINFYTDFPNGPPVDTDFWSYQRNQGYGNASSVQLRTYLFTSPSFTGNGFIPGQWHVGGDVLVDGNMIGNGATTFNNFANTAANNAQSAAIASANAYTLAVSNSILSQLIAATNLLHQIDVTLYVLANNGNGTNTTNWGVSTYQQIWANQTILTNTFFETNWPPPVAPVDYGQMFTANSNGQYYAIQSKVNALAWTKTNLISSP